MKRRAFPSWLLPLVLVAFWAAGSGFKFSDLIRNYTITASKTASTVKPAVQVTAPAAQTVISSPSSVTRDVFVAPEVTPEEPIGARSEITKIDSRLYIPESAVCTDVQDHVGSVKAIMNADDKTVLFNDACFLYNELISVWEKSSCQTQPPQRMDCCAEMNGKYWFHYDHLQIAGRWNTCSYWLYAYSCQRVNAAKQQCDVMNCSQNCDWAYDCSQNGYSGFFSSFPMNAGHEAALTSCLRN
jgi:hypothetical protein